MKISLISAAFLTIAASTASAQLSFSSASIDLDYLTDQRFSGGFVTFGGRADYDIGQLGMQLDGKAGAVVGNGGLPLSIYNAAVHVYKPFGNGAKFGGYAGLSPVSLLGRTSYIYSVGVEGMMSFGPLDMEAAISNISIAGSAITAWFVEVDAYYTISQAVELNAGVSSLMSNGNSPSTYYSIGAKYKMANIPVSLGANYFLSSKNDTFIEFVASYAFGPGSDERLFSSRAYPVFQGGL